MLICHWQFHFVAMFPIYSTVTLYVPLDSSSPSFLPFYNYWRSFYNTRINDDRESFDFRSAYILYQDSLPASYKSFLNKHGGKDAAILQGVKDIASGKPFTNLHAIKKYYKTTGVDVKLDPNMKVPCSVWNTNFFLILVIFS